MNRHWAGTVSFGLRITRLLVLTFGSASASAQVVGVSDGSILAGSCSALDGPARFLRNQTVLGATTYLHSVNDDGGVFGRKVQLLAFDDGYDPDKAPACFKRMTREGVFALGFFDRSSFWATVRQTTKGLTRFIPRGCARGADIAYELVVARKVVRMKPESPRTPFLVAVLAV